MTTIAWQSSQRGTALAIVLILLLLITLATLASLRGTTMQQEMATAALDRSLAFQVAEAALRDGESLARDKSQVWPASDCNNGLCGKPSPGDAPAWTDPGVWAVSRKTVLNLGGQTLSAKYVVELIADDVPPSRSCTTRGDISDDICSGRERRFRVTAISQEEGRAEVMLQSIYAVP